MATKYWLGAAVAIPEVKAYVFAGTWAQGDTATITINGKTLTLTAGTIVTLDQMVGDMVDMINGATANQDEERSALGSEVGEFALLTATADLTNDHVVLTGPDDGRPIGTVTVGETTAGDGTFAAVGGSPDTTGTGPKHFSDGDNWSGGAIPDDGDTIVFDYRAAESCCYGLTAANDHDSFAAVVIRGFRHSIGLPAVNTDTPQYSFNEHLPTYLTLVQATAVTVDSPASGLIKLDTGSTASAINVMSTGASVETGVPALLLRANSATSALVVSGGSVGLEYEQEAVGEVATITVAGNQSPTVVVGPGVTAAIATISAGSATIRSTPATLTVHAGQVEYLGGNVTILEVNGGLLYLGSAGTHATVTQAGGTIDCTKDGQSRTFTNFYMYGGSLKDPSGTITFTNGIRLYTKLSAVNLELPPVRKYTIGAV